MDIPLVHISTDYVFDGSDKRPWQPINPAKPQNAYGRSKLVGEEGVLKAGGRYAILRTSWVFSAQGSNFVKSILRLAQSRSSLNVVVDQIGGPTPARAIAMACLEIADQLSLDASKSGIYHFSGTPDVSWFEFAEEIFSKTDLSMDLTAVPTRAFPTPAVRPINSRLNCTATNQVFGISRPEWGIALGDVLKELEKLS